jgi:aminocarboxymuconate-semialdehyde decarboxylase
MTGIVDVHSHFLPRWYLERLKRRGVPPMVTEVDGEERIVLVEHEVASGGRPLGEVFWDLKEKLAFMDEAGIEQTALTLTNPWLDPFDEDESARMSERVNEEFAELEDRAGGRIAGLGALPNGSVEVARAVVREIGSESRLHGIVTGSRMCGLPLDAEPLDRLWEELADSGVPVLIHPGCGAALDELGGYGALLPIAVGFPFETTIAITRLLFAGVLDRYPALRILAAHGGGSISLLAARLDAIWRATPSLRANVPNPPSSSLRRLYTDAVLYDPAPITLVAEVVGEDHLMFGTDHPFEIAEPERNIDAIEAAIGEANRDGVLGGTARTVLRLPSLLI